MKKDTKNKLFKLNELPNEIAFHTFSFLGNKDLATVSRLNKHYYNLTKPIRNQRKSESDIESEQQRVIQYLIVSDVIDSEQNDEARFNFPVTIIGGDEDDDNDEFVSSNQNSVNSSSYQVHLSNPSNLHATLESNLPLVDLSLVNLVMSIKKNPEEISKFYNAAKTKRYYVPEKEIRFKKSLDSLLQSNYYNQKILQSISKNKSNLNFEFNSDT